LRLTVRVTPRGGRDAAEGWITDAAGKVMLKLRVRAAPTDGEANTAVAALVAKLLGRPKSAVSVAAGHSARVKQLELEGVTAEDLQKAFGPPPQS
jgi:uncharacterized protein YggU (UPF0235/DUF167 family)